MSETFKFTGDMVNSVSRVGTAVNIDMLTEYDAPLLHMLRGVSKTVSDIEEQEKSLERLKIEEEKAREKIEHLKQSKIKYENIIDREYGADKVKSLLHDGRKAMGDRW
jgi:hypothetical protein